ncbi:MAG TPA: hypothetical protein PKA27_13890 [Fimbriimonadaceae bacterium]|nr:hypothetical protein [Fimbriimonadaceae bacterium]
MIRNAFAMLLVLASVSWFISGCSSGAAGGLDKEYMKTAEQEGKEKREIFLRANGVFDAMSESDRKKYLSFFESETHAREFWNLMANPPTGPGPATTGGQ